MKILLIIICAVCLQFNLHSQENTQIIKNYLASAVFNNDISQRDLTEISIKSSASSLNKNAKHYYIKQLKNGLEILNSNAQTTILDGKVVVFNERFVPIGSVDANSPVISSTDAIEIGVKTFNKSISEPLVEYKKISSTSFIYEKGNYSKARIPIKLAYLVTTNGDLKLVWEYSLAIDDDWWNIKLSAVNGELLDINNWVNHCSFDQCEAQEKSNSNQLIKSASPIPSPLPPPGNDSYMVYKLPNISPLYANRELVTNPSDSQYSPYGWHDTNGAIGDEYTITNGNNVYAYEDTNDLDTPGYSPNGGSNLNFNFPFDSVIGAQENLDPAITNLFYMNNMMHDIWAYYGFDEESGNFQETNYSSIGEGFDAVQAEAHDGSGTNNANFGTPPDGFNPRMQMYLWSGSINDILTINTPASIAGLYNATFAYFTGLIPNPPVTANVVYVDNENGSCDWVNQPLNFSGEIVLVRRGGCTYFDIVNTCEYAGAVGVIIMNNVPGGPVGMSGQQDFVTIPTIMVSQADGNLLRNTIASNSIEASIGGPVNVEFFDSDYDNGVIAHEYGHGISNRLIGGANQVDCLDNEEQMGEGWSDWLGTVLTMKSGDQAEDPRPVGNYVAGQSILGGGIRPSPYSTDFAINDYTYGDLVTGNLSIPHGIGFVWATMLWDLNWALIDKYGFDSNMKTGTGGNNIAMKLVIEGLKLTMCKPSFVDGRDAILLADQLLNDSENECLIWEVFAKRGLGYSANAGSSEYVGDEIEAFDVPQCITGIIEQQQQQQQIMLYPNPTKDNTKILFPEDSKDNEIRLLDINGKELLLIHQNDAISVEVSLSNYSPGFYFLSVRNNADARVFEIIKQ